MVVSKEKNERDHFINKKREKTLRTSGSIDIADKVKRQRKRIEQQPTITDSHLSVNFFPKIRSNAAPIYNFS
jgi:hypothetical protein